MLLKSWKSLEDKTYLLGGFTQKAKPRDFIKDLLKEGEEDFLRRTGTHENAWHYSPHPFPAMPEHTIVLPFFIGRIKSVALNGNYLVRGESEFLSLDANGYNISEGTPTCWNLMGKTMVFNGQITLGDNVVVNYEHITPDENMYIKILQWNGTGGAGDLYKRHLLVEEHADEEFCNFWNQHPNIHLSIEVISSLVPYTSAHQTVNGSVAGNAIRYGRTGGTCAGYDADGDGTADDPQPTNESTCTLGTGAVGEVTGTWTDDGVITQHFTDLNEGQTDGSDLLTHSSIVDGSAVPADLPKIKGKKWQTLRCDKLAHDLGVGFGYGNYMTLNNYRSIYGPTIDRGFVKYLPYYALGVLLHGEDPKSAEFYMQKYINACEEHKDEYSDNDLNYSIRTVTRSNWRY